MYIAMILLLMLVLPLGSLLIELLQGGAWLPLLGKWFVFWGVGARLLIAGIRQLARPGLTTKMLGITDASADFVVRELGFANFAIGITGLASLLCPGWTPGIALYGAIFYALAGIQHAMARHRDTEENWAMGSDLAMAVVLAVYVGAALLQR